MTSKLVLVTGGARSGKSYFAEQAVAAWGGRVLYIATAQVTDGEMQERIKLHQQRRPSHWATLEAYCDMDRHLNEIKDTFDVALLDCLTVMTANLIFRYPDRPFEELTAEEKETIQSETLEQVEILCRWFKDNQKSAWLVTNEVGMGIVPDNALSRYYRDVAGRVNQLAGQWADEAWLVSCGLPLRLK